MEQQPKRKKKWILVLGGLVLLILLVVFVIVPLVIKPRSTLSNLAQDWQDAGSYISWTSTIPANAEFGEVNVFTIQKGDPANPRIVFIHGYPTSSFDFTDLFDLLSTDYYVCAIDTPGYGLSDKLRDGYVYSIKDDARLVDYYIREVLNLTSVSLFTHDKGSSVGFALLEYYQNQTDYRINHLFITNGNVYLPLAQLTNFQKVLLNPIIGPLVTRYINGDVLAKGLNQDYHTFPESDAKVDAIASIIDYQAGVDIQHNLIQYLSERAANENEWLQNLEQSTVPTTLIWGVDDPVAPLVVADYVWNTSLKTRETPAWYWQLPNANHYLQNDQPMVISTLVRLALGEPVDLGTIPKEDRPIEITN